MSKLKFYEFKCKHCGEIFEKEWTEEKALAEYRKIFASLPDALREDKEMLCDDCYKIAMIKSSDNEEPL